ncbi:MAG: copper-binding protein [Candidatus Rokubacteria bacterium]|nr:copper-binding protein [Candidatus Rokubacteria bacterium]
MARRWLPIVLFAVLLALFAAGLWGTIVRPAAYEVRGQLVARPEPGMILVRHEAVGALRMGAMEMMAVVGEPALIDAADVKPGDRLRLAVRPHGEQVLLLRIERLP